MLLIITIKDLNDLALKLFSLIGEAMLKSLTVKLKIDAMKWHYLKNQFLSATQNGYKKMLILSTDHVSRLSAKEGDPFFDGLIEFITPFHYEFTDLHSTWKSILGVYRGQTLLVKRLMNELVDTKIPLWNVQVQVVFFKNTPEYQSIFPKGLSLFRQTTYDERVLLLDVLMHSLARFSELESVKIEVAQFCEQLHKQRGLQQQYEGQVKVTTSRLKNKRTALAKAMYRNLSMLMGYYYEDPSRVSVFFELEHLQRKNNRTAEQEEEVVPLNVDGSVMGE